MNLLIGDLRLEPSLCGGRLSSFLAESTPTRSRFQLPVPLTQQIIPRHGPLHHNITHRPVPPHQDPRLKLRRRQPSFARQQPPRLPPRFPPRPPCVRCGLPAPLTPALHLIPALRPVRRHHHPPKQLRITKPAPPTPERKRLNL